MDIIATELNDLGLFAYNAGELYCFTGNHFVKTDSVLRTYANQLHSTVSADDIILAHYTLFSGIDTEFNNNRGLIAFTNCVYDIHEKTFRTGRPSDKITIVTGYHYTEPSNDHVNEVHEYLERILPVKSIQNIMTHSGVSFWLGSGNNGKTTLLVCVELALGGCLGSIPARFLTDKKRREIPSGVHIISVDEADTNVAMRYENLVRVSSHAPVIMIGNVIPKFNYQPEGFPRVVNFENTVGGKPNSRLPGHLDRSALFKVLMDC